MLRGCCGAVCLLNFFQDLHGWSFGWLPWCFSEWSSFQKFSPQTARGCWVPSPEQASCQPGSPGALGLGIPSLWVGSPELWTTGRGACAACLCGLRRAMVGSGLKAPSSPPPPEGSEGHWPSRGSSWKWRSASPECTACWLPEMESKNSVSIPVCGMTKGFCHQERERLTVTSGGQGTQLPRNSTTRDISTVVLFHG